MASQRQSMAAGTVAAFFFTMIFLDPSRTKLFRGELNGS